MGTRFKMAANTFSIQLFLNFLSIYLFDLLIWVGLGLLCLDIGLGWVWTAYSTQGCLLFNLAIHWSLNALAAILNLVPISILVPVFFTPLFTAFTVFSVL